MFQIIIFNQIFTINLSSFSINLAQVISNCLNCVDLAQKPNVKLFSNLLTSSAQSCYSLNKLAKKLTNTGEDKFFQKKWIQLSCRIQHFSCQETKEDMFESIKQEICLQIYTCFYSYLNFQFYNSISFQFYKSRSRLFLRNIDY